MKYCNSYDTKKPNYDGSIGRCLGTAEIDACGCGGDMAKCDFYNYIRVQGRSPYKVWKPNDFDMYYFIAADGTIAPDKFYCECDAKRYEMGNAFRTREEAEEEVTRRKMLKRWKDLSIESGENENPWDGYNKHWYVVYSHSYDEICAIYFTNNRDANTFFPTKATCEAAVKELGEENVKKYILGIKN